jgi:hypothetical protein
MKLVGSIVVTSSLIMSMSSCAGDATLSRRSLAEIIRAPFVAIAHRNANAFCSDFSNNISTEVAHSLGGQRCETSVTHTFEHVNIDPGQWVAAGGIFDVKRFWQGDSEVRVELALGPKQQMRQGIVLTRNGARWQIATFPILAVMYRAKSRVLWFSLGPPANKRQ